MFDQKNYSAPETHYICDVCSEAVTNPLCPFCLATEVEAWLTLYPDLRKQLLPKLKKYLEHIEDNMVLDATTCIKCGNNTTSVCPYCFSEVVLQELKKIHANKIILKEFLEFFNFDLHYTKYSEKSEQQEVI